MAVIFHQLELEWGLTRVYRTDLPCWRLTIEGGQELLVRAKTAGEAVRRYEASHPGEWVIRAKDADAMASTTPNIPIELMRPDAKLRVIEWIRTLQLPSRFGRQILQDWGAAVHVELNSTDYELVSTPGRGLGTR